MTLLNTFTLPGAYIQAIDTANRADAEAAANAAPAPRGVFDLPLWSAWGARTA